MGVMGLSKNIQQPWQGPKEHRDANHQKQGELTKKSDFTGGSWKFYGIEPTELVNGGFNGHIDRHANCGESSADC